jgi:hypothetical protein
MKALGLDVVTFVWYVIICGAEVPRPQPAKHPKGRVTWLDSLNELQAINF